MEFARYGNDRDKKDVLIIGAGDDIDIAYKSLSKNKMANISIIYLESAVNDKIIQHISSSDEVYICSSLDFSKKEVVIETCSRNNKRVFVIPGLYDISAATSHMQYVDDLLMLRIDNICLNKAKGYIKRTFDIIIAVLGIIAALPIMLFAAAAIKLQDGGPVLFCQERLTKNGKIFLMYKFRTMVANAEKDTGPVLARENDDRVTFFGRAFRDKRIDELPQLFNVIKGDMSIVGPRPERPHFAAKYSESIPEFNYRLSVKAGITGLAQVRSKYSTTPENKLRFDMYYIKNQSIWLDISILLRTAGVVFKKDFSKGIKENIEVDNYLKECSSSVHIL